MVSLLVAQINLAFQVAVFALLAGGFAFTRRRKIKAHAQVMLAAAVLNIVSFIAVMAPALPSVSMGDTGKASFLAMLHGSVGGLALLLSVWVVGVWLTSPLTNVPARLRCYGSFNKKVMPVIMVTWFVSLILGFLLYATLHLQVAI